MSMPLHEWIVRGEVGTSSRTIWAALTGAVSQGKGSGYFDVPFDPSDFCRCRKLVQQCNISTNDLQRVKDVFPWYGPYIDNWDTLNELYDLEAHTGKCEKLYDYMQTLHEESMILDGWEKIGNYSWRRKNKAA